MDPAPEKYHCTNPLEPSHVRERLHIVPDVKFGLRVSLPTFDRKFTDFGTSVDKRL